MSDLQSLRDFLVLTRIRSFSRAAEHCHVTTSGLSRRIQNLEAWLGAPVFHRDRVPLELTEDGQRLAETASNAVAALEAVRQTVRRRVDLQHNQIRIAAPHVMTNVFFPSWLPRLYSQFGQTRFNVTSALLPECVSLLDQGEVDYVITFVDDCGAIASRVQTLQAPRFAMLDLDTERLVPVSAPGVRGVAKHDVMGGDRLCFLDYSDECSLGWALRGALARHPAMPELVSEHGSSLAENLRLMTLAGLGAAWLPLALVREDLAAKRLVRAAPEDYDVGLTIQIMRTSTPAGSRAEALWTALQAGESQPEEPVPRPAAKAAGNAKVQAWSG